jgi:stage II sporulation protein D
MRFLLPSLMLLAAPASAETIRVAVAKGPRVELSGADLVARMDPAGPVLPLGPVGRLEAVGPFVSSGEQLATSFAIEDRGGGPVRIGATCLLGRPEVVACDQGLVAVDHVDVETYVASVVGSEMSASWPAAALEAQAIAARTYVLRKKLSARSGKPYDVEASVLHQVYKGAQSLDPRTIAAAEATRGLVLDHDGQLADAFFFASCAGTTESVQAAFGSAPVPYLVPTSCEGGEAAPKLRWTRRVSLAQLTAALEAGGVVRDDVARLEVSQRTPTGRIAQVRVTTRRGGKALVSGPDLRRMVGYTELPSLAASVAASGDELVFEGTGAGHGVGLCQWCAKGRAAAGETAAAILARAYPGTTVRRLE